MLDDFLKQEIDKQIPKVNKDIADGLSYKMMMSSNPTTGHNATRSYVDRLFSINQGLFPDGFKYLGNRVCSPDEMFQEITREYNGRRMGNIAKHDVYMVELETSFNGERLEPRKILLPFVRDGGIMNLNGASYSVSPVISDVGFSVVNGNILIPFGRTKLMIRQVDHHYFCDGQREVMYVIWSQIHNEMSKRTKADLDNRQRIETSIPHYFFCQFGVIETFRRWCKADIEIGYHKDLKSKSKTHVIYESVNLKGCGHATGDIAIAVPRNQDSDLVKRFISGVWYVVDTFPNHFITPAEFDSKELWQLILAFMIFGDFEHQGKIMENVESHLSSFNKYLDEMTQEDLKAVNIEVDNVWDLMHSVMTEMVHHFYDTDIDETSMYGKRLEVLRYVMSELNYAVSMFSYAMQAKKGLEVTGKECTDLLKRHFKLRTCINRLASTHGEFEIISYPGDSKLLKLTSMLVPQDRARATRARNKSLIEDSTRLIHASIAEVGQFKNHPKNNPDGRGRLNPFLNLTDDGSIVRNPKFKELIDDAQRRFRGIAKPES